MPVDAEAFDRHWAVESVELVDAAAQQFGKRTGLPLRLERVVTILDARALPEDEVPAALNIGDEILRSVLGEDSEARRDDQLIGGARLKKSASAPRLVRMRYWASGGRRAYLPAYLKKCSFDMRR